MSKILVLIGVTGKKSGKRLTEKIEINIEEIHKRFSDGIRVIVRASSDTTELDKKIPNAKKYVGELTDVSFLKKVFKEVDTVIHIAGIHWSCNIVKAAEFCNVRRLILVHTTGIYSKYKKAGKEYRSIDNYVYQICKKKGIILTILRPTMIYGNITDNNVVNFIKMVDNLPVMPIINGAKYELQPVHYEDLGDAYYSVLVNEQSTANRDFNLSGGEPILLQKMLLEIGNNLGKKVKFINCPFWLAYSGAWVIYGLSLGKNDYREKVQRLCEPRIYSHNEATNAFGYSPRKFQVGIVDEVKEYLVKKGKNESD